jgi:hypothetical protein
MLIEYPEPEERRRRLAELKGIEDRAWVQVAGCARVFAIADEDMERENAEKTSAVHFVRFELDRKMRDASRAAPACRSASTIRTTAAGVGGSRPKCALRCSATWLETLFRICRAACAIRRRGGRAAHQRPRRSFRARRCRASWESETEQSARAGSRAGAAGLPKNENLLEFYVSNSSLSASFIDRAFAVGGARPRRALHAGRAQRLRRLQRQLRRHALRQRHLQDLRLRPGRPLEREGSDWRDIETVTTGALAQRTARALLVRGPHGTILGEGRAGCLRRGEHPGGRVSDRLN